MYETIIIGGGQAGLAMGYFLKKNDHSFLIIDKEAQVGENWRNRYDSLELFTPRMFSSLPGFNMKGKSHGLPTKDEVANYLVDYANNFELPIQFNTKVNRVHKENSVFYVETTNGVYQAENIVVATGPFQKPRIPLFSENISKDVVQLHSSKYRNPSQIREGTVLVVGGGNSGAQIALELSNSHNTYLSVSKPLKFLPLCIAGKSIFWWFKKLGILNLDTNSFVAKKIKKLGDPIFGYDLKHAIQSDQVSLLDRAIDGRDESVFFENFTTLKVDNIIWATGFDVDFSWIDIPELFDENGSPLHQRGVTSAEGLYFLGLPWQYRRGSALLQGVGFDAEYLYKQINGHLR